MTVTLLTTTVKHFLDVYDIRTLYQERRLAFPHKTSLLNNNVLRTVFTRQHQCRINYGSGGSPEPGPLNSGGLIISHE